jgi:hypothetical protein
MEPRNDLKAHEKTYGGFLGLLKWSVPIIAVIVFVVVLLIS